MIRVEAPSRLHFGVLSLPPREHWPNLDGEEAVPARWFGGVGLMVREPGVRLTVRPANEWSADGPLGDRALAFARRFIQDCRPEEVPPQHIEVERCAPEHMGLGAGTQLGLAVARALAVASGFPTSDAPDLAWRVGRGARSALGIHGFAAGGFLVEAGKRDRDDLSPLVARAEFPNPWRLVLIIPTGDTGIHGAAEERAFSRLGSRASGLDRTDARCRLVVLGLLPALAERDLAAFGEALYDFNARAGEAFAPVQGGRYASPRVAELVAFVRRQGVPGVGQSSWGPAVFAVVGDEDRARDLARRVRERFALGETEVVCAAACNRGAVLCSG
jgi:beta-ribofuranosylaminobenzene 5'-phosphate synthase